MHWKREGKKERKRKKEGEGYCRDGKINALIP
jgi:hypothetical protein